MTDYHHIAENPEQPLAKRLAPMSIAEIEAMTDQQVAELMGATPEQLAAEPVWMWREAAKVGTDEWADRLIGTVKSGRARVTADPAEIRRHLGGRPRVGGASGHGPSSQVRVRVTSETRTALENIAAAQGRRVADVSREALDEYIARHIS